MNNKYFEDIFLRNAALGTQFSVDLDQKFSMTNLYPEFNLENKSVGYFDPYFHLFSKSKLNLSDLFPFYDSIIIPLRYEESKEEFESFYGLKLNELMELYEMGKIYPVLKSSLGSYEGTDYLEEFNKLELPHSTRILFFEAARKSGLDSPVEIYKLIDEIGEIWAYMARGLYKVDSNNEDSNLMIKDISSVLMRINILFGPSMAFTFLLQNSTTNKNIADLHHDCTSYNLLFESLSIPFGSTISISGKMKKLLGKFNTMSFEAKKDIVEPIQESLSKKPHLANIFKIVLKEENESPPDIIIGDLMVELKREFFFESPLFYRDPVKYAYSLNKSDNIFEHRKILMQLKNEIVNGNYNSIPSTILDYKKILAEVKKEIKSYEKYSKWIKNTINFGGLFLGGISGAIAETALGAGMTNGLFIFSGAAASFELAKENSDVLSKKILKSKHSAYMIWEYKDNKTA